MTISVGGVTLPDDMTWEDEFDGAEVAVAQNHTIGGRAITDAMTLEGGRTFTLASRRIGDEIYGALTRTQVQALKAVERAGLTVSFIYESQTFLVKVKAVQMRLAFERPNPDSDDEYTGSIAMAEV